LIIKMIKLNNVKRKKYLLAKKKVL